MTKWTTQELAAGGYRAATLGSLTRWRPFAGARGVAVVVCSALTRPGQHERARRVRRLGVDPDEQAGQKCDWEGP